MNRDDRPAVSGKELKKIVASARKLSQSAFPNPTRSGCPDRAILRALAHMNHGLAWHDLPISHVVRCSPCFQEYIRFRRKWLLLRAAKITAAALSTAALFLAGVLIVRNRPENATHSTVQKQAKSIPSESGSPDKSGQAPSIFPMKIDLAEFLPTRGDQGDVRPAKIHLPRRSLKLTLQMPFGMKPGEYLVELKGHSGTVYSNNRAAGHIENGLTLVDVNMDLAKAPRGEAVLMIQPPRLNWRSFPALLD